MIKSSGAELVQAILVLSRLQRTGLHKFSLSSGTVIEIKNDIIIAIGNTSFYGCSYRVSSLSTWDASPWALFNGLTKKIRGVDIEIDSGIKIPVDKPCTLEMFKDCISAVEELDFNISFIDGIEDSCIESLKIFLDVNHMYLRLKSFVHQDIYKDDIDEICSLMSTELFKGNI